MSTPNIMKREKMLLSRKAYREANKEKILTSSKVYREANKEKIRIASKKYYEEHKEELNQKCKKYNEEHKEELTKKRKELNQKRYICDCGIEVLWKHKVRHSKTNKHIKRVKALNDVVPSYD